MFKSLIAFCLSRRAIVVAGLLLFAVAGLIAFKLLNIEAYPNPTPVILEITAQAPGLSAEEMERYYTRSDGDRPLHHSRHRRHPLHFVLRAVVRPRQSSSTESITSSPTPRPRSR